MPSLIQRAASKSGLVLLNNSIQIAEDGFVSLSASFLAPASGLRSSDFELDSAWPLSSLPAGLPALQGGPFLANRSISKRNGLTYVDALFVSALNPVRVLVSETDGQASFSGFAPARVELNATFGSITQTVIPAALLSFDYTAVSVKHSYAVIGDNAYSPAPPEGRLGDRYNVVAIGATRRIPQVKKDIITRNVEKVGRVQRISVTANPYLQTPYDQLALAAASPYIG